MSTVSTIWLEYQPGVYALSDLVETYSGHRLHERPLRFCLRGSWHTAARILSRWQEPGILCFTVTDEGGQKYSLKYNQERDIWKVDILSR